MKRQVTYSNWRDDLREVVDVPPIEPKTRKVPRREVKEGEKVNNKVVINPTMAEANEVFKEIGGTVLDIQETQIPMSPEELRLLTLRSTIDQKIAKAKTKNLNTMKKSEVQERALTDNEKNKKEDIVKGMKKKEETGDAVSSGAFDAVTKGLPKGVLINTKKKNNETPWYQNHLRTDPKPNRYDKKND